MQRTTATVLTLALTGSQSLAGDPEVKGPPAPKQEIGAARVSGSGVLSDAPRVRVKLAEGYEDIARGELHGRVLSLDDRTMVFEIVSGQKVEIPTAALERLQVHRGRHPRSRGALYGALVGGAVTGAVGAGAWIACQGDDCLGAAIWTAYVVPVAMLGAGLIGLAATPGERWETVTVRQLKFKIQPVIHPRGAGVVVSF